MRPGVLLMALLIAFAFIFLLAPSRDVPVTVADRSEIELASAEGDENYPEEPDESIDYDEDDLNGDLTTEDPIESDPVDEDPIDDGAVEEEPAYEEPAYDTEGSGEVGEGYDDDGAPRPGDDEPTEERDPVAGDDEVTGSEAIEDELSDDEGADDEGRHRECIYVRSINGYRVIDDKHLTVSTSPRRIYLVTLWNRCYDLKWSHQIAIKAYSSWTCSHSRDYVITEENRCIIDNIERVSSYEEAVDLVAERAGDD